MSSLTEFQLGDHRGNHNAVDHSGSKSHGDDKDRGRALRRFLKKETVVRQHRPYVPYLLLLMLAVLFLAACFIGFRYGQGLGARAFTEIEAENRWLLADLDRLNLALKEARQEIAASELKRVMLNERLVTLGPELSTLTETVQELEDQAAYYRNLIKHPDQEAPVVIELAQWADRGQGTFDFWVLLTRSDPSSRTISGVLKIDFVMAPMKMENHSDEPIRQQVQQPFSLKYFKRYEGSLSIPEGAVIQSARIGVEVDGLLIAENAMVERASSSEPNADGVGS